MKNTLRFIVAGLVLAGVIFGVWAIFFNPDKKVSVNERLMNANAITEKYEIPTYLDELELIYDNGINGKALPSNVKVQLDKLFSYNIEVEHSETYDEKYNSYKNYNYYQERILKVYNFYAVYSRSIKSISSKDLRTIKSKISKYDTEMKNLKAKFDKLKENLRYSEDNIPDPTDPNWSAWFANIEAYCNNINSNYRSMLYSLSDLTVAVKNICTKYAFDVQINTTQSIINDCVIYQAFETFKVSKDDSEKEVFRIVDLELFCLLQEKVYAGEDVYASSSINEMELIYNYTTMQTQFNEKLFNYFELTRENKYLLYKETINTVTSTFADCLENINSLNKLIFSLLV